MSRRGIPATAGVNMLVGGSVTVTGGIGSGAGLAKAIYDALQSALGITPGPQNHAGLSELGKIATALGPCLVTYFTANSTITATPTLTVAAGIAVTCPPYSGATTATGSATGTVSSTLS